MFQPYSDAPENRGDPTWMARNFLNIADKAADAGLSMSVHAIGDRANHEVLDAFEQLRSYETEKNLPHLRHRIEHVQVLHPCNHAPALSMA